MNAHSETAMPAVECIGLSSGYRDRDDALSGVAFCIAAGERVGIVGPNGAGKSTLLRALVGVQPISGDLRIAGLHVEKRTVREIRSRIGLVFQNPDDQLFSSTIQEDVAFGPLAMGLSADEARIRVDEALASVGMEYATERNPLHLSYGERRLAAIATVLSMRPSILAMDEPSSNLDPRHRRRLIDWLNSDTHFTLLLASHDLDMVAQCCDRVLILDRSIRADAPAHELLSDAALLAAHGLEPPLGFQKLEFRSLR